MLGISVPSTVPCEDYSVSTLSLKDEMVKLHMEIAMVKPTLIDLDISCVSPAVFELFTGAMGTVKMKLSGWKPACLRM